MFDCLFKCWNGFSFKNKAVNDAVKQIKARKSYLVSDIQSTSKHNHRAYLLQTNWKSQCVSDINQVLDMLKNGHVEPNDDFMLMTTTTIRTVEFGETDELLTAEVLAKKLNDFHELLFAEVIVPVHTATEKKIVMQPRSS